MVKLNNIYLLIDLKCYVWYFMGQVYNILGMKLCMPNLVKCNRGLSHLNYIIPC